MRFKNFSIYVMVVVIVILSFCAPNLFLNMTSDNIEKNGYEREQVEASIDVETEKIYLVRAIHDIENGNNTVQIASVKDKSGQVRVSEYGLVGPFNILEDNTPKELSGLMEYGVLKDFVIEDNTHVVMGVTDMIYRRNEEKYNEEKYIVSSIHMEVNDIPYKLEVENKTGKVLRIITGRDALNYEDVEQLMMNYIKYLDLYIIDDWKYEDGTLISKKAGLTVTFENSEDKAELSVHSVERNNKYIKVYQSN